MRGNGGDSHKDDGGKDGEACEESDCGGGENDENDCGVKSVCKGVEGIAGPQDARGRLERDGMDDVVHGGVS